jgi:hypothetical protein
MRGLKATLLMTALAVSAGPTAWAGESAWEYRVVILQGVTAGGSIEKQSSGVYVDTKRTSALNELAAQGWEVIAVIGAPGTDHAVYLRRTAVP